MEENYKKLLVKLKRYNPNPNLDLVASAWEFAKNAHKGQVRLSGDPTISHPLAVADILADWKLDSVSIASGLLHDTIEDCGIKKEELAEKFGDNVAELVDGVTKIGKLKLRGSKDEAFVENLRKMLLVMAKDLRVVFLRLADRLHNMQTLQYLPKEKQNRIARETLEIFAPLAERLGIGEVKGQLEDLAFPYVYPKEYKKTLDLSRRHFKKAERNIEKMRKTLLSKFAKDGIKAEIHGRKKHLYSLYRKLQRPEYENDITNISDLVALRIIVDTVSQCYTCLGIVHKTYKPVPHMGVSDFIAVPKPNGYRSIHTNVFSPGGANVEVQIRTLQMHEQAEFGLASHWHYSLMKSGKASDKEIKKGFFAPSEQVHWVKQLVEWQEAETDSEEFLEAVKFDALSKRIFVFSPNGDVFDLPAGATPIDFAYAVHTDLGEYIKGAKVNGKIESLDYKLKSGDVVEIMKTKEKIDPKRDWLESVVTRLAKRKISGHLRKKA